MVHVSELQGYLMKEKSKTGILHGLTGDINKRFFKVQKIEVKIKYNPYTFNCCCTTIDIILLLYY